MEGSLVLLRCKTITCDVARTQKNHSRYAQRKPLLRYSAPLPGSRVVHVWCSAPVPKARRPPKRVETGPQLKNTKQAVREAETCTGAADAAAEISSPPSPRLHARPYSRPSRNMERLFVCVLTVFVPRADELGKLIDS